MKGRKEVILDGKGGGEGLGRIAGRETIIRMYYMRK